LSPAGQGGGEGGGRGEGGERGGILSRVSEGLEESHDEFVGEGLEENHGELLRRESRRARGSKRVTATLLAESHSDFVDCNFAGGNDFVGGNHLWALRVRGFALWKEEVAAQRGWERMGVGVGERTGHATEGGEVLVGILQDEGGGRRGGVSEGLPNKELG